MKEEDGYDYLLDISQYPALIQLKYSLDRIHHCVTAVGKWIIDSNFPFALPLKKENLDYYCIYDSEAKVLNGYKRLLKTIGPLKKILIKVSSRSENSQHVFDNIKTIFKGIQNKCHNKNQHTYK